MAMAINKSDNMAKIFITQFHYDKANNEKNPRVNLARTETEKKINKSFSNFIKQNFYKQKKL